MKPSYRELINPMNQGPPLSEKYIIIFCCFVFFLFFVLGSLRGDTSEEVEREIQSQTRMKYQVIYVQSIENKIVYLG